MADNTFTYDSTTNKYLDLNGLKYYDGKIKNYIDNIGSTLTGALDSYYTIAAADAKFATIANFNAHVEAFTNWKTTNDADVKYSKDLWTAFLADYTDDKTSPAPTLQAIKNFMTAVPTTYATISALNGAIDDIAALTTTVGNNATAATNAINAVDAKAVKNADDIAALTTTVENNATAASNALATAKGELEGSIAAVDAKAVKNAEDIVTLKNGLSGAVHFRGVITPNEDGSWDLADKANGDIVIVNGAEYVYVEANAAWEKLGDTTSESDRISTLENTVAGHTTSIAANGTAISTLDTKVEGYNTTLTGAIAANGTAISTLDTKVEGYNTTLTNAVAECVKLNDFIEMSDINALFTA